MFTLLHLKRIAVNASVKALESAKFFPIGSTAAQNDKECLPYVKNFKPSIESTTKPVTLSANASSMNNTCNGVMASGGIVDNTNQHL